MVNTDDKNKLWIYAAALALGATDHKDGKSLTMTIDQLYQFASIVATSAIEQVLEK